MNATVRTIDGIDYVYAILDDETGDLVQHNNGDLLCRIDASGELIEIDDAEIAALFPPTPLYSLDDGGCNGEEVLYDCPSRAEAKKRAREWAMEGAWPEGVHTVEVYIREYYPVVINGDVEEECDTDPYGDRVQWSCTVSASV